MSAGTAVASSNPFDGNYFFVPKFADFSEDI